MLVIAYMQETRISTTVAALARLRTQGVIGRIVVVDDGSTDQTAEAAEAAGAEVVRLPRNVGKGGATWAGLSELREGGARAPDVIVLADGDLGDSATELTKLVEAVTEGRGDMAIAVFPAAVRKGGFGIVKGLARWGIRRATGLEAKAPLSGQRALRLEVAQALDGIASGFGMEVGLTIDVARAGFRIVEVPAELGHSETGRDVAGFRHRGRQFLDVAKALVGRLIWRRGR